MKRPDAKDAPGLQVGRPAPTRLHTHSEEQDQAHLTPIQREAFGAVYELIAEVARRVRDEGQEAA